jgi:NAD(P)-dependent dehydrogenase (short-subunit alcohol dehydrogenase family)
VGRTASRDRRLTVATDSIVGRLDGGSLQGKVAIVTGGGSGIGRAVAERVVAEGGRVAVGDIDERRLAELASALGDACASLRCDVTEEDGPASLVALAVDRFGALDVAVANAGGGVASPIVDHDLAAWRAVLDLTLTGCFLTVQAAARAMTDGGSIVAIASLNAVQPGRGMAAYCAAKAGVVALVGVAALELGPVGIRVNAVAPGLVRTSMTEPLWSVPGMVEGYTDNTALGRYAEPHDIAAAVAFLASDDASFVTGETLLVDGGAHHLRYPDNTRYRSGGA